MARSCEAPAQTVFVCVWLKELGVLAGASCEAFCRMLIFGGVSDELARPSVQESSSVAEVDCSSTSRSTHWGSGNRPPLWLPHPRGSRIGPLWGPWSIGGGAALIPWALIAVNSSLRGLKRSIAFVYLLTHVPVCCGWVYVCVLFIGGWALDRSHAVPLSGHTSMQDESARLYLFGGTFIFRVAFQLISPPATTEKLAFLQLVNGKGNIETVHLYVRVDGEYRIHKIMAFWRWT